MNISKVRVALDKIEKKQTALQGVYVGFHECATATTQELSGQSKKEEKSLAAHAKRLRKAAEDLFDKASKFEALVS